MDIATARALITLNNSFYADHAASFSATRSTPWAGWNQLAEILRACGWSGGRHAVLDLACGNLRFEQFLAEAFPLEPLSFHAVDSCPALASNDVLQNQSIAYHEVDILENACLGIGFLTGMPACDLSACFGFMHHIPGVELRKAVLAALVERTASHGLIALSFWRFMDDERLARKALRADEIARIEGVGTDLKLHIDPTRLDENDHFLGWQSDGDPLRYCHNFPEVEIDELVASVGTLARECARYSADGPSGNLNRYLVLEKL